MQLQRGLKNTHDPLGEGGDGGEVQQKFPHAQVLQEGHLDEVPIGDAVAGHGEDCLGQLRQQLDLLRPEPEGQIHVVDTGIEVVDPVLQPENTDVLGHGDGFGDAVDIALAGDIRLFLVPVAIHPAAGAAGDPKPGQTSGDGHQEQNRVQMGENGQVDRKAAHVFAELGQRMPKSAPWLPGFRRRRCGPHPGA